MTKPWRRSCDLCKAAAASVRCDSDAAFLCFDCDAHVHEANFLVARHLRKLTCSVCNQINSCGSFSGARFPPFYRTICCECHHLESTSDDSRSSSSSSSCISTADNTDSEIQRWRRRKRKRKTRRTEVSVVPSKLIFLNESSYVDDEGWGESSSSS